MIKPTKKIILPPINKFKRNIKLNNKNFLKKENNNN